MSYHHLPIGSKAPQLVNAVIETPKGTRNKFEYREDYDLIALDRVLHSPVIYPADYGFLPQTRSEDGDHLDILVFTCEPVFPGCVVEARPLAAIDMEDEKGKDWKIVAVSAGDPNNKNITDIEQIGEQVKKEIQHFFEIYKHLEEKEVMFRGWLSQQEAYQIIESAVERFKRETHG
jgi:inorganic pyrophosphatase